jgi:ubiquinone/menaquinone biosynthesis C-methylase UbiE
MALDAAYGTSRFAELLASRGHQVIGVDSSPDMPACAAACPDGESRLAALDQLPLPDDSAGERLIINLGGQVRRS